MLQQKQSDPSTKAKEKPCWGFMQSKDCAAKTYSHSKLQNFHLFRFSLQMWRDAKNEEEKQEEMTT